MDERIEPMSSQHLESSRLSREQGHELKNIFSIIIANAEMVGEELGATGQVQRRLERIMDACRRGEGLVERIRNPEIREKKTGGRFVTGGTRPNDAVRTGAGDRR